MTTVVKISKLQTCTCVNVAGPFKCLITVLSNDLGKIFYVKFFALAEDYDIKHMKSFQRNNLVY